MSTRALIIGAAGQDGTLLTELLKKKGYIVDGLLKGSVDLLNTDEVSAVVSRKYQEIYYLATFHHSAENLPLEKEVLNQRSYDINCRGPLNFLQAIETYSPLTRFFYASSSHIFDGSTEVQSEITELKPTSVYASTKVEGMRICQDFRNRNIFASVGILFNHESHLRSPAFVSRKVTQTVARIFLKQASILELGSLDSEIDWGYAGDYVEAIWRILQLKLPDNYIISSGETRTLKEFVEIAFSSVNLDYRDYVVLKPDIIRKTNVRRIGNSQKLRDATGWAPKTSFEEMIKMMVREDIKALQP